jgi:O-antigen/teichoic acid export membrane protein
MKIPGLLALRSFSTYAFVMFFNAAVSFGVFSWLTHQLSPADFGTINLYSSYSILLLPFISCGVQFILSVDYFRMKSSEYSAHFQTGLLIPVGTTVLFVLASLLSAGFLNDILKANTFFIIVAPFSCMLILFNDIFIAQVRNRGKHNLYAGYSIFKTLSENFFTVGLVVLFSLKWQGRLGGALISLILCGFIVYYFFSKWDLLKKGGVNRREILKVAVQGMPFIPERLAIFFMSYSDRFFIDYFRGVQSVGLYGAGAQVGTIINLVTMALSYTFQPVIFRKMSAAPADYEGLRNVIAGYIGIALLFTVLLIILMPFLFNYFIGDAFRESSIYATNLAIAGFFWAVYNTFLSCLLFLKKNREIMCIAIVGMITSILLNIYNVKHFGPLGATYSNIIVYIIMASLVIIRVHKHYNLGKILRTRFS